MNIISHTSAPWIVFSMLSIVLMRLQVSYIDLACEYYLTLLSTVDNIEGRSYVLSGLIHPFDVNKYRN